MSSDPHKNGKGYGTGPYGSDPYGSLDTGRPEVVSVVSLTGRILEVTFSEPVLVTKAFLDPDNWEITSNFGRIPTIQGIRPKGNHPKTVQIKHSGTTLGSPYTLTCKSFYDLENNPSYPLGAGSSSGLFLAHGNELDIKIKPQPGNQLAVLFDQPLAEGKDNLDHYVISTEYPVTPLVIGVGHKSKKTKLFCRGLTEATYELTVGPSRAIQYRPNDLPDFADEFGSGMSTLFEGSHFLMEANEGDSYGWSFYIDPEAVGQLGENSAFRADVKFADLDAPSLAVRVSDAHRTLSVALETDGLTKRVRVESLPEIDHVFSYDWTAVEQVTVLRNSLTGHVAVLLDGNPVFSAAVEDMVAPASWASGVQLETSGSISVSDVSLTASDTMYSEDGNFVHEAKATFFGLLDQVKNKIIVDRGPLTKGWGDATPAGINDVAVRVNGVEVGVVDVNPYLGFIYLETPVPKMNVGEIVVEADYFWFETPQMSFRSLNHPGLVLNKWDHRRNPEVQSSTLAIENLGGGSKEGERFPIALTLLQPPRVRPKWVSHRHIGFDNTYTASLNSPTALVLNADPYGNRTRKSYAQYSQSGKFEGTLEQGWEVRGNATLQLDASDGYADLTSDLAAGVYKKVESNPVGAAFTLVGRVESVATTTVNNRLTLGPAIAFHDTKDLRLLAGVQIDDVSYIAMLVGDQIDQAESWQPVCTATATFLSGGRMEIQAADLPELFYVGLRVVVPDGSQTGHYTVTAIEKLSTGNYWLSVTPDFPADVKLWGGGFAEVYFEIPWQETRFNFHLVGRADNEPIGVAFTGAVSFSATVDIPSINAHVLYSAGTTPLDLTDQDGRGEILFGNLVAGGNSRWDFVRYLTVPDDYNITSIGHLEALTLHELPTEQTLWRATSAYGLAEPLIDDRLSLQAIGGPQKTGFEKLDALIPEMAGVEVSSVFKVESPTSWGDAGIRITGPNHDVMVCTIPYRGEYEPGESVLWSSIEPDAEPEMFIAASASLIGGQSLEDQGWQEQGEFEYLFEGLSINLSKAERVLGSFVNELPYEGVTSARVLEARLKFNYATFNDLDDAGIVLGMDVGDRSVALLFANGKLILTSDGVNYLAFAMFDWLDGQEHHYKVVVDTQAFVPKAILYVDGVEVAQANLADFDPSSTNVRAYLVGFGAPEWNLDLYSFHVRELPPPDLKRTLGIWKGGDPELLSSWETPRDSDGHVVEMGWDEEITTMVVIDPGWGASLMRPDLPPPDGYVGDGRTSRHDPTGAWATVEWEHLPILRTSISTIHFGMQNSGSLATSVWDNFRYRVYIQENEDRVPPRMAILNRWNVLSSGEYTGDITVENVRVKVRKDTLRLRDANIRAKRIFHVAVNGDQLANSSWTFDQTAQTITIQDLEFPNQSTAEVAFSPGRPITKTYLLNQPLKDGITKLNEGTPPYLLTQLGKLQRALAGEAPREDEIIDLISEDPDFASQDPTTLVEFSHESAYSSVDFFQVEDGNETGLISTLDDGIAPAKGLAEIDLQGRMFVEVAAPPPAYPFEQGGGAPGAFLTLGGGGDALSGTLGGGEVQGAVTWPSAPSRPTGKPSLVSVRTFWDLRTDAGTGSPPPFSEESFPQPIISSLEYEMLVGAGFSRLGPWGGIEALAPISMLNGGSLPSGMVLFGGASLPEPSHIRRSFNEGSGVWED